MAEALAEAKIESLLNDKGVVRKGMERKGVLVKMIKSVRK